MEEIQNEEDNATQSIIENSLDDPTSKFIIDCQTAYEMIEELKSRFDQSGPSKLYKIEYKIKTLKIENNDYKLYLNNLNTLFESHKREANKLGKSTLDEETKILFAADELVKIGIHPINLIQFKTFSDLKNSIITMEVFIKKCKEIKRIEENPNLKNQVNAVSKTNINKPNNKNYEIKNKENYCYICQKDGHTTDTCFFNVKRKNKNRNNPRKNDIRKQKGRKNTKFHSNNIKNESDSTDSEDSEEENINIGFSGNIMVNNITQSTKENDKTEWIIDSGCPINLTNEIRKLKNTKNIKNKSITYPNGKSEKIKKVGKYIGTFDNNSLELSKVYYADNIKNNLLSTHCLVLKGYTLIMDYDVIKNKDRLQIYKNNKLISTLHANDDFLFTLNTHNINNYNLINNTNVINFDYDLWHARLGHFNNNKNIQDFVLKHTNLHNKKDCSQCHISKMKKKPFYSSFNKSTHPLQLIHSDVVGKFITSYNGYNYYVTFLDDFSRKCWIYLLKNKSDVCNAFIHFHKLMKNTTSYNIVTLKTDNGREYDNANLIKYLLDNGIEFIHSLPNCPQQNGRAERLNQTLDNCVKTLLSSAKLPINFWDSAILCACRLYNLNPHQGNNSLIPDEVFFNKLVDISHLKVFGCRVYFYNNHKKNKLDNNTKPGIFLGYASDSTGYKILDITTNSIISARDVYFMENIPGSIETTFLSNDSVDSLFNFDNSQIQGEHSDNNSQFMNNQNLNNNLNNNNSNTKNINMKYSNNNNFETTDNNNNTDTTDNNKNNITNKQNTIENNENNNKNNNNINTDDNNQIKLNSNDNSETNSNNNKRKFINENNNDNKNKKEYPIHFISRTLTKLN